MKNILVATDFSDNARHAAHYGFQLASQLKMNLILCNAFVVPAEMPEAGLVTWPMYEYDELQKANALALNTLKSELQSSRKSNFEPLIGCVNEEGVLTEVINGVTAKKNINLIVLGAHGRHGLSSVIMGNHSRIMIDDTTRPLLIVPQFAPIKQIKKIAFATDFKEREKDLKTIYELIDFIRPLNAEVLITHIHDGKGQSAEFKKWLDDFLVEISNKANYPNLYYRIVENDNTQKGLEWLCERGHIDVLAMAHRQHSFLDKLINGSHTQKMAVNIIIPLLIIPEPIPKING